MAEEIDLVLSGSGTLLVRHIGAWARLVEEGYVVRRVAGTSGGAIVAAGIAHGWPVRRMLDLAARLLQRNLLLDPQATWWRPWGFLRGYGVHALDRGHKEFLGHLPGRMDDAELEWGVFVTDLETLRPRFIHSARDRQVRTADAVIASASIPVWARMRQIDGLPGAGYVDGGVTANLPMDAWDDRPDRMTVGVSIGMSGGRGRRQLKTAFDFGSSLASVILRNGSRTHVSQKDWARVIYVPASGSALNFDQSRQEIDLAFEEGQRAAEGWIANQKRILGI